MFHISKLNLIIAVFVGLLTFCGCSSGSDKKKHVLSPMVNDPSTRGQTITVETDLPPFKESKTPLYSVNYPRKKRQSGRIVQTIPIDSVMCPEYELISLETTENCLLGNVTNLQTDDSLIFVWERHHQNLFVFNKEGKYLNRIGERGNSEKEYIDIKWFTLIKENKEVCILDWDSKKLKYYDYKGKFLRAEPVYCYIEAIEFYKDRRVLHTLHYEQPNYPELDRFKLTVTDGNGVPVAGALHNPGFPSWSIKSVIFTRFHERSLKSYPDGVFFSDILSPDTIWQITGEEVRPFCCVDLGPGNVFTTPTEYRQMTDELYHKKASSVCFVQEYYECSKHYVHLPIDDASVIIDRRTGRFRAGELSRNGREYTRNLCQYMMNYVDPRVDFTYEWETDRFAKVLTADHLVHIRKMMTSDEEGRFIYNRWPESDRKLLESITLEDNPVLLIVKMK